MTIKGYIVKTTCGVKDYYLSGVSWVSSIKELKLSDISTYPREIDMSTWPMMEPSYENAQITITIEI